jgi:hypothetical protein
MAHASSRRQAGALISKAYESGRKPNWKLANKQQSQPKPKPSPVSSGASMEEIFEALRQ